RHGDRAKWVRWGRKQDSWPERGGEPSVDQRPRLPPTTKLCITWSSRLRQGRHRSVRTDRDLVVMMAQVVSGALLWIVAGGDAVARKPAPVKPPALPGMRVVPFVPGGFAGTLQHQSMRSCSQSYETVDSHATVTLDLAANGAATGCRSRDYRSSMYANPLS